MNEERKSGFTLIELSIVLVIIGLIVGGVLAGRDLISAAGARATITQVEKYNTAANTFFQKYAGLPGDLNATSASQFGFIARGTNMGQGDGNGILESYCAGYCGGGSTHSGVFETEGETVVFWVDLSTANLIDGNFVTATETTVPPAITGAAAIANWLPPAKLGNANFVYAYSSNGGNYFGISAVISLTNGEITSSPGFTVQQAYNIDKKIDDGLPQSGRVTASYLDQQGISSPDWAGASPGAVASPSATTCYDNGGNASNTMAYSLAQNNGAGMNCALSFKMQAGD